MKRKIVKHGEATMTVSLPSKWLKKFNIQKGDEIDVQEKENHLILGLDEQKWKTETSLNLSTLEESSVRTSITNAYRLGYDKIKVTFDQEKVVKIISEVVEKNLLGFEVIKKGKDFCLIESVTEPAKEQFDNIFSKVLLNTEEMFNIIESPVSIKKLEFEEVERKIMQYDNFCRRIIAKRGIYDNNFLQWSFHSSFVHATRELYHLSANLRKGNLVLSKEDLKLLAGVKKIFETLRDAYNSKNIKLLEKIQELEKEFTYKEGYSCLKKSTNPAGIFHLMVALKHFYLASSPLMGMLIS